MTVKVRSSAGDQISNETTPDMDSPATITVGDLLVIVWCFNDDVDPASGLTPPSGWTLEDEVFNASVGDRGMRYAVWTKTADSTDVTNAGTANYYSFSGMGGATDILYGIFSLYDDAAGTVEYQASSLADTFANDVSTTTTSAPTQTVSYDGSMSICGWAARQGTDYYNIGSGNSYSPTGGANAALLQGGWTTNTQSGLEWAVGTAEWDVSDSPIGTQTLTHTSITGSPSAVDTYSVSMIFEVVSATSSIAPIIHHRKLLGIQ